jgi:dUTP pyrophosphatase
MNNNVIFFSKVYETSDAKIPSKTEDNAGYDCYPCFNEEYVIIKPHSNQLIPLGIASAFSSDYVVLLEERGSTGINNIKRSAGVIDSSYRGMWFACLYNGNDKPVLITKEETVSVLLSLEQDYVLYSYYKAICQALLLPVPKVTTNVITYEDLQKIESERGTGCLGSTGK